MFIDFVVETALFRAMLAFCWGTHTHARVSQTQTENTGTHPPPTTTRCTAYAMYIPGGVCLSFGGVGVVETRGLTSLYTQQQVGGEIKEDVTVQKCCVHTLLSMEE